MAAEPDPLPSDADETRLLREMFRAHPDALLLVDNDGRIARANPAACGLLGYSLAQLQGLNVDALVPPLQRMHHDGLRKAYARAPRVRPMGTHAELVALRQDGQEVPVEIALGPVSGLAQPYVVAAVRDVRAYPRMQQVLQRAHYSEQLAQLGRLAVDARDPQRVLDQVPASAVEALKADSAMVFLLDAHGVTFRVASSAGQMLAMMPTVAPHENVPNQPEHLPGFVLRQGQPVRVDDLREEVRFAVPTAWIEAGLKVALAVPLSDRGRGIGVFVVCARDSRHFGDDELNFVESLCNLLATCLQRAHSEDTLKHAQRLETVGQLTGGIAHDFNNLLTIIQGNLQVLQELPSLADDAQAQQLVAAAARASRRGADLTGKLLAFSRRQMLQPDAVDVRAMLHSLADMLRRTLDQRIQIDVQVEPDCPSVRADPGQLDAALLNIAVNARDAMLDGGRLRFAAAPVAQLPPNLHEAIDEAEPQVGGYVAIAVSDSGSGMTEEVQRRAFEPFFTTKDPGRGTGLGLSTVYGFVKQSKGVLTLNSMPGQGTTLTLYLPQPARAAVVEDTLGPSRQALPGGLKVLLVEDDADVRAVVLAFLEAMGCHVTAAGSGEQALLALDEGADIELLVSDIALGAGMRGMQLATLAQQRLPELVVLLMSGYSAELLQADTDAPATWELLRKPFTREQLATAMTQLITERDNAR